MLRAFINETWITAEPADAWGECAGCIFQKERHAICKAAGEAAIAAGLPDCDSRVGTGFIYVRDPSDGRQADLLVGGEA
jgi:hypothetical protein